MYRVELKNNPLFKRQHLARSFESFQNPNKPQEKYETQLNNQDIVSSNGKQLFGYAGQFDKEILNRGYGECYVSLMDDKAQTHYINTNLKIYHELVERFQALNIKKNENLFFWTETSLEGSILNWRLFKSPLNLEQTYPLFQSSYDFLTLYHLFELVDSLNLAPLKRFMNDVLSLTDYMKTFVSLPASKRHHHSFPGGLLSHSIECALLTYQTVRSLSSVSENEAQVAMVSALLHDFGKIKTLGMENHTSIGRLIDHEQLTLMLLAVPLNELSGRWPQGADTLQYLLQWKEKMGVCRFVSGNAIKMADRLSTSASLRSMAFDNKPGYFHFAEINIGSKKHYLNRLN
jgi:hypothetical protein